MGIKAKYISISDFSAATAARRALAQLRMLEMQAVLASFDGSSSSSSGSRSSSSSGGRGDGLSAIAPLEGHGLAGRFEAPSLTTPVARLSKTQSQSQPSPTGSAGERRELYSTGSEEEAGAVVNNDALGSIGKGVEMDLEKALSQGSFNATRRLLALDSSPTALFASRNNNNNNSSAGDGDGLSSAQRRHLSQIVHLRQLASSAGVAVTYTITLISSNVYDSLGIADSDKHNANAVYSALVTKLLTALTVTNTTSGTSAFTDMLQQAFAADAAAAGYTVTVSASSNPSISDVTVLVIGTAMPTLSPTFSPTVYTEWLGSPEMGSIFVFGGLGSLLILAWCFTYYAAPVIFGYKRRSNSVTSWRYPLSFQFWRQLDPLWFCRGKKQELNKNPHLLDGTHSLAHQARQRREEDLANRADPLRRKQLYLQSLQNAADYAQQSRSGKVPGLGPTVPRRAGETYGAEDDDAPGYGRGQYSFPDEDGGSQSDSSESGVSGFESETRGWEAGSSAAQGAGAGTGTGVAGLVSGLGGLIPLPSFGTGRVAGPADATPSAVRNAANGGGSMFQFSSDEESKQDDDSTSGYSSLDGRPPLTLQLQHMQQQLQQQQQPQGQASRRTSIRDASPPQSTWPVKRANSTSRRSTAATGGDGGGGYSSAGSAVRLSVLSSAEESSPVKVRGGGVGSGSLGLSGGARGSALGPTARASARPSAKNSSNSSSGGDSWAGYGFSSDEGSNSSGSSSRRGGPSSAIDRDMRARRAAALAAESAAAMQNSAGEESDGFYSRDQGMDSSTGAGSRASIGSSGSKRRVSVAGGPAREPSPPRRNWPVKRSAAGDSSAAGAAGAGGLLGRVTGALRAKAPVVPPPTRAPSYSAQARRLGPGEEFEL